MNILIVTQHYWPENFRINDISDTLTLKENNVTVLCGLPNYPSGYIYDNYKHRRNRKQIHNNINIIRVKEIGRRKGFLFRLLNYWSYPFFASKMIKHLDNDFDIVIINEVSPIMVAKPAVKYGKMYHKPVVMYEMDLWPESLLAGNIKKNSFVYNHYKKVSSKLYSKCDMVLTATKEHIDYIKKLPLCSGLDIRYLPQYAESIFENSNYMSDDNKTIDIMFAGNIGKAQSVISIIKAAGVLNDDPKFKFHIIGDGSELNNVKNYANKLNLRNIVFYGNQPLSEMPSFYALADIMIVSLENKPYANLTIPGKVQSYMAAGKPIIGVINGSCANFIKNNEIGYTCNAEDYVALANLIKNLKFDDLIKIGKHSKEVYKLKYSKDIFFNNLIKYLNEAVKNYKNNE